jgi:O-antigen/teichoic acid export membrane protein
MPVLARALGPDRFGLLGLAWTLVGYASLLDFGLGRATTQVVSARLGRAGGGPGDGELAATAWTALALLAAVAAAIALPLAAAAAPLARGALRLPPALVPEAETAARWLAVALPFAVVTGGLRGLLEAAQRFDAVNALRVPMAVATYLGPLAAAAVLPPGRALVWAVALVAGARVAFAAAHAVACWRALPWLRARPRYDARDARALLAAGGWMSVSNVLNPLLVTLDRFALGAAASAAAVGYYTGALEVATKMQLLTGAVFPVFFPAVAQAAATAPPRAAALVSASARLVLAALAPAALALVALAPELLGAWLGAPFARGGAGALRWLAAGLLVNCVGQAAYHALQAAGHARVTALAHLAQLPPFAAALWWAAPRHGAAGVAAVVCARLAVDAAAAWVALPRVLPAARGAQRREAWYLAGALAALAGAAALPGPPALRAAAVAVLSAAHAPLAWRLLGTPGLAAAVRARLRPRGA